MLAVGRNEVDQRLRVPDGEREVKPIRVGPDGEITARVEQLTANLVERRDALAAAARQVEHRQVERQSDQPVAHGLGHELVDLVGELTRPALEDAAGCLGGRKGGAVGATVEFQRIEERIQQGDVVACAVGCLPGDRFGQHRVAEAIRLVGKLGDDRRVD